MGTRPRVPLTFFVIVWSENDSDHFFIERPHPLWSNIISFQSRVLILHDLFFIYRDKEESS